MSTTSFYSYLLTHLSRADLTEVSELFPSAQVNDLFIKEIDKLLDDAPSIPTKRDLRQFREMDFVAYIDGSLRRAHFQDHEIDGLVNDIVTKLLLGNFFKGFREGSLIARFKRSVSNAIATLVTRRTRYRRRNHELPGDIPGRSSTSSATINHFRSWLRLRYGAVHERVLDHRLDGLNSGDLIGTPGVETSYKLKRIVREIKEALKAFARNDPEFLRMVMQAFSSEAETINKRFGDSGR